MTDGPTPEQIAEGIIPRLQILLPEDADDYRSDIAAAIREAVAAERAKWVAACWEAHNDGYKDQGWTVLYEMGATDEVQT